MFTTIPAHQWSIGAQYKVTTLLKIVSVENDDDETLTCSCVCFLVQSGHTSRLISDRDCLSTCLLLPPDSDLFKGNSL